MEDEKFQINIPANVKTRTELISGIGVRELIHTVIAGVISIFIDIFIYAITQNYFICLIIFGVFTGFTFIAVMKDKNNNCIMDMIINMYKFFTGQKYFEYSVKETRKDGNNRQTF